MVLMINAMEQLNWTITSIFLGREAALPACRLPLRTFVGVNDESYFTEGFYPRSQLEALSFNPTQGALKNDMGEGGKTSLDIKEIIVLRTSQQEDAADVVYSKPDRR